MFFLFGTKTSPSPIVDVTFECLTCGVTALQHVTKRQTKVTLYFVPIIPLSTSHSVQCTNCGAVTDLTAEQAQNAVRWAQSRIEPGA